MNVIISCTRLDPCSTYGVYSNSLLFSHARLCTKLLVIFTLNP